MKNVSYTQQPQYNCSFGWQFMVRILDMDETSDSDVCVCMCVHFAQSNSYIEGEVVIVRHFTRA